jgi:TfoX/Sxy family transcriptional regulator of competence genes
MTSSPSTIDFILDQLSSLEGMMARKMFGDYALYCGGKVVGLVCENNLYIKITEPGKKFVGKYYHEGYAYKGAKLSMMIDGDRVEDDEWLCELVRITAENVWFPKKKVKKL